MRYKCLRCHEISAGVRCCEHPAHVRYFGDEQKLRRKRIGFVGTVRGLAPKQRGCLSDVFRLLAPFELHVGDSPGADREVLDLVIAIDGCSAIQYDRDYLRIVVNGKHALIVCPSDDESADMRTGVHETRREAMRVGRPTLTINPDGTQETTR